MDNQPRPAFGRRTIISEGAGLVVDETGTKERQPDALAHAFPEWDLVPATQFLRRR